MFSKPTVNREFPEISRVNQPIVCLQQFPIGANGSRPDVGTADQDILIEVLRLEVRAVDAKIC